MNIKQALNNLIKGNIIDNKKTLENYSRDASLFKVTPKIIVHPNDVEDIKTLVKFANENPDEGLSLTVRSGGTDMTGGPLTESIILDMTTHFNHTNAVNEDTATVEPGVYYRDFERETFKKNLLLPSYPASREICTLGGMIANNSGGEKTLAYGKTANYVRALNVVLSDGNEYVIQPLEKSALMTLMRKHTFEGKLYRYIFQLLEKNKSIIDAAKPNVSKNSAGYALWDIWDGKTFDLTKLFVGSQGTLGIITKANIGLIKPHAHRTLLVIFVRTFTKLGDIVNVVLKEKPESFESFDDKSLKLALRYIWELIALIKPKNIFSLALQFLPELWMFLTGGVPKLILLAEFTGDNNQETKNKAEAANMAIKKFNLQTRVTTSEEEARKYLVIRRESFNLARHHLKQERTAPCIDDIIVQPEKLPEFLPAVQKILDEYKLNYTIQGHVGDGNFHIIPLMKFNDEKTPKIIPELMDRIYNLTFQFKGSMTAEHNDGLVRSPYLKAMYGEKIYALFEEVKKICDPKNIFNPGKKTGASIDYAIQHLHL